MMYDALSTSRGQRSSHFVASVERGPVQFDFLGYTFGRRYSAVTGKARIALWPSRKSIRRMVEKIHTLTDLKTAWQDTTDMVGKLNRTLRGWANYFQ